MPWAKFCSPIFPKIKPKTIPGMEYPDLLRRNPITPAANITITSNTSPLLIYAPILASIKIIGARNWKGIFSR